MPDDQFDRPVIKIVFQWYLIVAGFIKMLFFLRMYQSFGLLVEMVAITMVEIVPFLFFFLLWVTLFALLFMNFGMEIEDAEIDYYNVPLFFQYLLMSYRNSIGDISTPRY